MLAVLTKVGTWLLKNPAIFMTAIVSVMFVMVVVSKNSEIDTLDKSINDPKTGWIARNTALAHDNQTLKENNTTLASSVAAQNVAFDALKQKATDADAKFDVIITGMASANASTARKLAALDAAKPGPDKCVSALALVKGAVQ